ncbi:MAG TPA: hypothetical protein VFT79_11120, partial [Solirubrobacterales bacterium]|nr:hypothetical protein [Solirubrobacterales bacterium]
PEEEFAMTRGEKGHPEMEGYAHTRLEGWEHPDAPRGQRVGVGEPPEPPVERDDPPQEPPPR